MNDNEVKGGLGNQQDYGMRIYDPRTGRFFSIDPLTKDYPELTPYQFSSNNPIENIDLDGLEGASTTKGGAFVEGAKDGLFLTFTGHVSNAEGAPKFSVNQIGGRVGYFFQFMKKVEDYIPNLPGTELLKPITVAENNKNLALEISYKAEQTGHSGFYNAGLISEKIVEGWLLKKATVKIGNWVEARPTTITGTQATAANSGNVSAAQNNAASKSINFENFGSEFLDDAIRTVDQPLELSSKSSYWIQRTKMSSLNRLMKGQYAKESVMGDNTRNFSSIQPKLNEIGNKYGCHTCGVKTPGTKSGNWIPDHQPPMELNPKGPFELYPHCKHCSVTQGGQVLQAAKKQ